MKSVTVRAVLILVACGSFLLLFAPVLARLVQDWANDDNYSHGFLILPLALYFVWERRTRLSAIPSQPTFLGLGVVAAGLALLLAGLLGAELFLTRLSIIVVAAGAILFLFGWATCRVLVFPLSFLLLMIPIPALVFNQIAFPLQLLASRVGESVLSALGIPVLREGNVIVLAHTSLEVAEACSGIRSLISLLTLGIVYGYFTDPRIGMRLMIALSTIPIAIVTNSARVAGTGVAAHYYGVEAAQGFFHTFSGWLVFVVAFGLLFVVTRLLIRAVPRHRGTEPMPAVTAPRIERTV
jgi:exosortase